MADQRSGPRRHYHDGSNSGDDNRSRRHGGDRTSDRKSSRRKPSRRDDDDNGDIGPPSRHEDSRADDNGIRRDRRHRDRSRSHERSYRHDRSRSPPIKRRKRSESRSRSPPPDRKSRAPLPSQDASFRGENGVTGPGDSSVPLPEKQKPNYKPTGLLAKEANTVAGTTTVLKYHEPAEARKPPAKQQWRMYVFKDKDLLDTIYIHTRSAWLVGRDEKVTDYLLEHPSASKQHAVIQFRHRTSVNEFGDKTSKVKPYLIDLESANGTKMNGEKIKPSRYVELVDGDVVRFGDSEREYVMMLPPPGGA